MSEILPDLDAARQLCEKIERAWNRVAIPQLVDNLKNDREFGEFFDLVAGKHWSEIDIEHRGFKGECWVDWLPAEAQPYYLGSLLYYCVGRASHPDDLEDRPFFCLVYSLRPIAQFRTLFNAEQIECVIRSIHFIRNHLEHFDCHSDEVCRELDDSQLLWNVPRTRIGDEPDRVPLEGTQGDRQAGGVEKSENRE